MNHRNPCAMPPERTRIAIDLSCLVPQPLTGVGYYTLHLMEAFLQQETDFEAVLFAASAQAIPECLTELARHACAERWARWPTRLRNAMWTRLAWPPIERFTGPIAIAHGAFHLLPASRKAKRVATVFDLSGIRFSETHEADSTATHLRLLRHAAAHADGLIAISQSCKQDIIEILGVPEDRVHVVYGGVDAERFAQPCDPGRAAATLARLGIDAPYFIHLGTIEPRKNLPRLVEAYARVRAKHPGCPKLVLAGKAGWMVEPTFEAIRRRQLEDSIIHTGYVSQEDAVLLLQNAAACVYPSLYEGFGLPVLEAMAAGIPVLTSNVSSLPEVVGGAAILVDPANVDDLAGGVERLVNGDGPSPAQLDDARQRARSFSWSASAAQLAAVYRSLME